MSASKSVMDKAEAASFAEGTGDVLAAAKGGSFLQFTIVLEAIKAIGNAMGPLVVPLNITFAKIQAGTIKESMELTKTLINLLNSPLVRSTVGLIVDVTNSLFQTGKMITDVGALILSVNLEETAANAWADIKKSWRDFWGISEEETVWETNTTTAVTQLNLDIPEGYWYNPSTKQIEVMPDYMADLFGRLDT